MKRICQRVFNWIDFLSMLLCAATVLLWLRSYWAADQFTFERNCIVGNQERMTSAFAWSTQSGIYFGFARGLGQADPSAAISLLRHSSSPPFAMRMMVEKTFLERHGFMCSWGPSDNGYINGVQASKSRTYSLSLPHWFLTIALMAYPVRRIVRSARRSTCDQTTCAFCGYDLRATPARCPECGQVPAC